MPPWWRARVTTADAHRVQNVLRIRSASPGASFIPWIDSAGYQEGALISACTENAGAEGFSKRAEFQSTPPAGHMVEIEDLGNDLASSPRASVRRETPVVGSALRSRTTASSPSTSGRPTTDVHVPGTSAIWLKTFGCSHNTSDAEFMAGQLDEYGYRLVDDEGWVLISTMRSHALTLTLTRASRFARSPVATRPTCG